VILVGNERFMEKIFPVSKDIFLPVDDLKNTPWDHCADHNIFL
jgi:hypothetical protein